MKTMYTSIPQAGSDLSSIRQKELQGEARARQRPSIEHLGREDVDHLFDRLYPEIAYLKACSDLAVVRARPDFGDWHRKPDILDMSPERIWKCLYLQTRDGHLYGVALPMTSRVDWQQIAELLELPPRVRKSLRPAQQLPRLQRAGSCTPFLCRDEGLVRKVVIQKTDQNDALEWGFPGRDDLGILATHDAVLGTLAQTFHYRFITGDIAKKENEDTGRNEE